MFEELVKKIEDARLVPVVKMDDVNKAVPLAKALLNGGIKAIEITFRTTQGEEGFEKIAECIKTVSENCPEILLGAGTVINPELAQKAVNAGAKFIVSPGFNPQTVDWCIEHNVPVCPGIDSPSFVEQALAKGLNFLKLFPAEVCGGTKMLDALSGPFPTVKFMATGGINSSNASGYFKCKNLVAIGGSWMVKEEFINSENWERITKLSELALESIQKK